MNVATLRRAVVSTVVTLGIDFITGVVTISFQKRILLSGISC
jgi:hypothetical protein